MRFKSLSWIFIPFLLAALRLAGVAEVATTPVTDTIYHADGTTATGTVLISWPAFTTVTGDQVPAGNTSAAIASDGTLSVHLVSNSGAIPIGSYYTVTYHLDDSSVTRQYWVVPQSTTPVRVAAIQSSVLPTSVAMQMVTKSYVDTAIAAATHAVDTSPLVLKAGDTMSGPLVLPADPVASLQAATKHYVDTAVATQGSGGITGQTPTYVPLATSATTSTTSSHFYESSNQAGVTRSFAMQQSANLCNYVGEFPSCNYMNITDDGSNALSSRPGSLTGFHYRFNGWGGGGAGKGGGEGRVTMVRSDQESYSGIAHAGIKQLDASGMSVFGIGDIGGIYHQQFMEGGVAYGSDQGTQNYMWLEQNQGHFAGTIGGGTNTQPTFSSSGGCFSPLSYACAPSPGAWMIDTSTALAAGKGTSAQVPSAFGPLYSVATDQTTIPHSTVYGTALNIHIDPSTASGSNGWDDPKPTSITIGAGGGTGVGSFAAGDHACVIGIGNGAGTVEQNIISAVSGSAGAQTITIPLSQPEVSVAVFQGDCMYMSLDADYAKGIRYAIPAVSIDGAHILYGYPAYGQVSAPSFFPQAGATFGLFDGGANSGFHLYAGARVLKVASTNPQFQPFAAPSLQTWLEPNSAFASGDTVEGTNYHAQKVDGLELRAGMANAAFSGNPLTVLGVYMRGYGASAASAAIRSINEQQTTDATTYTPWGGRLSEPQFIHQEGPFDSFLQADLTPLSSVLYFNNHQPGQTSYNILRDPSWGTLSLQPDGMHFTSDIYAGSYWSSGIVSGLAGLFAGPGSSGANAGVRYSYGNGTTAPVWIAPCNSQGNANDYLCVTSHGASRTSIGPDYNAAADKTLVAGGLALGAYANVMMRDSNYPSQYDALDITNPLADNGAGGHLGAGIRMYPSTDGLDIPASLEFYLTGTPTSPNVQRLLMNAGSVHAGAYSFLSQGVGTLPVAPIYFTTSADALVVNADATVTAPVSMSSPVYKGPATAPTGSCSVTGWAFSQDGHISFCDGATWTLKM